MDDKAWVITVDGSMTIVYAPTEDEAMDKAMRMFFTDISIGEATEEDIVWYKAMGGRG